jgi:hypothetical protein
VLALAERDKKLDGWAPGPSSSKVTVAEQAPGSAVTPQPRSKAVNEQLKAERPHRGGPRPIETGGARWGQRCAATQSAGCGVFRG